MERDLRVVGARLDAQVAAAAAGIELVARAARAARAERRPARAQAHAVLAVAVEEPGPRPTVIVSRRAPRPTASPVSRGRHLRRALDRARRLPGASSAAPPSVQTRSSSRRSAGAVGGQVEGAEDEPLLRGRRDPRLVGPSKATTRASGAGVSDAADSTAAKPAPPAAASPRAPPPASSAAPSREPGVGTYVGSTLPATSDSGSASEVTCWASVAAVGRR